MAMTMAVEDLGKIIGDVSKIKGDLEEAATFTNSMVEECAGFLSPAQLNELRGATVSFATLDTKVSNNHHVLKDMQRRLMQQEALPNLPDFAQQRLQAMESQDKSNIQNHTFVTTFNEALVSSGVNVEPQGDEDLYFAATKETLTCPITSAKLQHPVKSRICGHVYEEKAITALLQKKRIMECPVAGCNVRITKQDLQTDKVTEKKLKMVLAEETQANEDSDEEEEYTMV